jgi:transposase-like protein
MKEELDINLVALGQKFSSHKSAWKWFEKQRWPDGPFCPHCQSKAVTPMRPRKRSKSPARFGLHCCQDCYGQFTVTKGTIFEDSQVPMNKCLLAIFLMCSSKKGMSAHQLHRMLKVTYSTAWFMAPRIRHAMTDFAPLPPMDGTVEIDETYVGGKPRHGNNNTSPKKRGRTHGEAS